jgi:hypothetical protein
VGVFRYANTPTSAAQSTNIDAFTRTNVHILTPSAALRALQVLQVLQELQVLQA